jgi:hypothetical protein
MLEVVAARRFKVRGGPSVARCPSVNDDEGSHGFGAVSGPVAWHVRKASLGSWRDGAQGRLLWCLAEEEKGFASSFGHDSKGIREWRHAHGAVATHGGSCSVGTVGATWSDWHWGGRYFQADWYCSYGPGPILATELIFQYLNQLQILKFKMKTFLMLKNIQTWHEA